MTSLVELPIGAKVPEIVTGIIEIPLESTSKYEYDKLLHVFRLDRNLHSPVDVYKRQLLFRLLADAISGTSQVSQA